jgi:hypothetical protein
MDQPPIPAWVLTASDVVMLAWLVLMVISTTTLVGLGILWLARIILRPARPRPPPDRLTYPSPPGEQSR